MKHETIETNAGWLIVLTLLVISVAGLVEILPLYFIDETVEKVEVDGIETVRPYTPLELAGRDIYQREGCYLCHSQMIRPFRDEKLRYGHYSLAAESKYDHPFQWGSKRTGPDLARVGGKSIMPNYPWLQHNGLSYMDIADRMRALKKVGVPYSESKAEFEQNVKRFGKDVAAQLDISIASENLLSQSEAKNFDGNRNSVSEMDALIAYLQVLGTMVDFSKFDDGHFAKFR
jgi:cytochrome c oxidase cbb3-type subunit II